MKPAESKDTEFESKDISVSSNVMVPAEAGPAGFMLLYKARFEQSLELNPLQD